MSLNWSSADLLKLNVRFNFKSWNIRANGPTDLSSSTALYNTVRGAQAYQLNRNPSQSAVNSAQRESIQNPIGE